jgi:hypothetical protein
VGPDAQESLREAQGTEGAPAWHQALAFALLGKRRPELGRQPAPDLERLVGELAAAASSVPRLREDVASARRDVEIWPFPVPADLMAGIGAAQFWAALGELEQRSGLIPGGQRRTVADRPPDAADRHLQRDVPPHHGG